MNRRTLALVLLAALLAGCQPALPLATATLPPPPPPSPAPTPAPTASLSPAPTTLPSPQPTLAPEVQATPFADCTLVPVLATCRASGKTALPLSGRLALLDRSAGRLVVVDFKNGAAWQAKVPETSSFLRWSPSGQVLAVQTGERTISTWSASGAAGQAVNADAAPAFTPANALDLTAGSVWSKAGDQAWMKGTTAHLRLASQPGKEITWPMAATLMDRIPRAIGFIEGSNLLLFEAFFGSNSMWFIGGQLFTLNIQTGAVAEINANMKVAPQFAWHPTTRGLLVFGDSQRHPLMGGQRLATLNALTGEVSYLLPNENVSVSYPSYIPDGQSVLFAASLAPELAKAGDPYARPAIYLLNLATGALKQLTNPPNGLRDDQPRLLADRKVFIYYRLDPQKNTLALRLGALDGSLDEALSGALAAQGCLSVPDCAGAAAAVYWP